MRLELDIARDRRNDVINQSALDFEPSPSRTHKMSEIAQILINPLNEPRNEPQQSAESKEDEDGAQSAMQFKAFSLGDRSTLQLSEHADHPPDIAGDSELIADKMQQEIATKTRKKSCCDPFIRILNEILLRKHVKHKLHGFFCPYFMAVHWRLLNFVLSAIASIVAMPYMSNEGLVKCFAFLLNVIWCFSTPKMGD